MTLLPVKKSIPCCPFTSKIHQHTSLELLWPLYACKQWLIGAYFSPDSGLFHWRKQCYRCRGLIFKLWFEVKNIQICSFSIYKTSSLMDWKKKNCLFLNTIIQSITSSEMCSLHLTHPSAHTSGAVGWLRRGAVGGSVPCSRVSPHSWTIPARAKIRSNLGFHYTWVVP